MSRRIKEWLEGLIRMERGVEPREWGSRDIRVALVYPNTYNLAMSNLGFLTVYRILSRVVLCERAFLPDEELLPEFHRTHTPLLSLESRRPLSDFHIIAFSISFEEDYLNIPLILDLCRLPLRSIKREGPLVVGGGVATFINPEPVADFFDAFLIGEGEELIPEFIETFRSLMGREKGKILEGLLRVEGVYVPSFYRPIYGRDKRLVEVTPLMGPGRIKRRRVDIRDLAPEVPVLTPLAEFGDRFLIEVSRGCPRGCRFCAAGFVYLPPRERDEGVLERGLRKATTLGGKVGLLGTAVSEYPHLRDLLSRCLEERFDVSISSMRVDTIEAETLSLLRRGGYRTLTIAPEAGSERLRRVINKPYTDEEILSSVEVASAAGMRRLKLYFMVGLPTEEEEDIEALVDLTVRVRERFRKGEVTLKVGPFIPKPWTPFQWHPYERVEVLRERMGLIRKGLRGVKGVRLNLYSPEKGYIHALLSLGDRRVGRLIEEARGGRGIKRALRLMDPSPDLYVYRKKGRDEVFPWDIIDHGIRKEYLYMEYERALRGLTTPPCDVGRCRRCGVC